jgi:uncharacterized cupin superfamily protein
MKIKKERPSDEKLLAMGVTSWGIWEKEESSFGWYYDESETCFILEGRARVEPQKGEAVEFGSGDMVTFPKGMKCTWTVIKPIRKYYKFGD